MIYTKEKFKELWESNDDGGGITNGDCADCYVAWKLGSAPYTKPIHTVVRAVVKAAGLNGRTCPEACVEALQGTCNIKMVSTIILNTKAHTERYERV